MWTSEQTIWEFFKWIYTFPHGKMIEKLSVIFLLKLFRPKLPVDHIRWIIHSFWHKICFWNKTFPPLEKKTQTWSDVIRDIYPDSSSHSLTNTHNFLLLFSSFWAMFYREWYEASFTIVRHSYQIVLYPHKCGWDGCLWREMKFRSDNNN